MGLFEKRSDDFELLDLPMLRKKGLLKVPEEKRENIQVTKDGFIELMPQAASAEPVEPALPSFPTYNAESPVAPSAPETNPFGFLDSMAQSSSTSPAMPNSSRDGSGDLNAIKIKLEDFEYKMDRLIERLERIEMSLDRLKN